MHTLTEIQQFCMSFPAATHVVQLGASDVYMVGGKVFATAGTNAEAQIFTTFKASEMSFKMLKTEPGIRPAPYMASRGLKWLQRFDSRTLDDEALCGDGLRQSYAMVVAGLSRKQRMALQPPAALE